VDPAPLPASSGQDRGDGVDQALVGVGDDEGHPGQPSGHQTPEEGGPAGSVLGGDEVNTQDLPVSIGVHPGGHHHGHVDDPASLSDLLGEGVHPDVGVGTGIEGSVAKGGHRLVQGLRQLGDLGLGDPGDPHRLHHVVDPAGGDPFDVALGDHGHQGPFRPPSGLDQPVRKVTAGPELRDGQVDGAGPRVPAPGSVAVPRVQ
jgi:hypothetical protein